MAKRNEIYKCAKGLTMEFLNDGETCSLQCCGEPVTQLEAKTEDAGKEKHVPVVCGDEKGTKVKLGSIPHPMDEDHFIEWIEVINGDYVNRKYLHPGEAAEAEFYVPLQEGIIVRAYCNKHGLWRK